MIEDILKDLKEQSAWHKKLATSTWHKDDAVMQEGHTIAANATDKAIYIVEKHAVKTQY